MPKKPSTKTVETEQVVAAPAPVVEKKAKKPKVEKPVDLAASVPVVEQAADTTAAEVSLSEQTNEFQSKLHQIGALLSALKTEFRSLEKKWSRDVKTAQKQSSKRKRKAGNRAPSGFVKPTKISDELATFLGKEKGTEMARTDVTREINAYIRANKLQDQDNGRKIIPDTKLATLLKLKKSDELTYFNLQKFMSPHFAKAVKDAVV
jgi:chromatin remodeling complex protein RSC6